MHANNIEYYHKLDHVIQREPVIRSARSIGINQNRYLLLLGVETMKRFAVALLSLAGLAGSVRAGTIPYPNPGTSIPPSSVAAFTSNGGDVVAYFYGSDAGFDSQLGLWADGVQVGTYVFPNHSTSVGDSHNFGPIAAGKTLMFELAVDTNNSAPFEYSVYSDPARNPGVGAEGTTQAYSTDYSAGQIPEIPVSGIYVGFEDRLFDDPLNDVDYNDHQFVFTNVNVNVPEPGSLALLLTGMLCIAGWKVRKRSSRLRGRNQ